MRETEQWHWQEPETAWKGVGIYHITLSISSREPLLGDLVIPDNDPAKAYVARSELGNRLLDCLWSVPQHHPEVHIICFDLMPNHLHTIWHVTRPMPTGIRTVVRGFWQAAKALGRAYSVSVCPNGIRDSEHRDTTQPHPLFGEMPFIRPLSRRGQLDTMMQYTRLNPQRLATMRLYPGLFRVQEGIVVAGRNYSGVGKVPLLHAPRFMPVHVRRTMVEEAEHGDDKRLRDYMNSCVQAARSGTVMVSPFISPQEKLVQEVLLREKHPFILIVDNGFRNYYKPSAALFDAVADGRVLILSPWPYDANKRHVSRADCVAMNSMAAEICTLSH